MFRGNYQLNMDAKGRLAVPKKYRDCLEAESGPKMVITTGEYEDCLVVYPLPEWQRIEERLRQQPDLKPGSRRRGKSEGGVDVPPRHRQRHRLRYRFAWPPADPAAVARACRTREAGANGWSDRKVRVVGRVEMERAQHRRVRSEQGQDSPGAKQLDGPDDIPMSQSPEAFRSLIL